MRDERFEESDKAPWDPDTDPLVIYDGSAGQIYSQSQHRALNSYGFADQGPAGFQRPNAGNAQDAPISQYPDPADLQSMPYYHFAEPLQNEGMPQPEGDLPYPNPALPPDLDRGLQSGVQAAIPRDEGGPRGTGVAADDEVMLTFEELQVMWNFFQPVHEELVILRTTELEGTQTQHVLQVHKQRLRDLAEFIARELAKIVDDAKRRYLERTIYRYIFMQWWPREARPASPNRLRDIFANIRYKHSLESIDREERKSERETHEKWVEDNQHLVISRGTFGEAAAKLARQLDKVSLKGKERAIAVEEENGAEQEQDMQTQEQARQLEYDEALARQLQEEEDRAATGYGPTQDQSYIDEEGGIVHIETPLYGPPMSSPPPQELVDDRSRPEHDNWDLYAPPDDPGVDMLAGRVLGSEAEQAAENAAEEEVLTRAYNRGARYLETYRQLHLDAEEFARQFEAGVPRAAGETARLDGVDDFLMHGVDEDEVPDWGENDQDTDNDAGRGGVSVAEVSERSRGANRRGRSGRGGRERKGG